VFFFRWKLKYTDDYYFEQSMDPLRHRKDLLKTNWSVNAETTRNLGRPAIKVDNGKTGEGISPQQISSSRTPILDVDEILERSLPKPVSE